MLHISTSVGLIFTSLVLCLSWNGIWKLRLGVKVCVNSGSDIVLVSEHWYDPVKTDKGNYNLNYGSVKQKMTHISSGYLFKFQVQLSCQRFLLVLQPIVRILQFLPNNHSQSLFFCSILHKLNSSSN
jgi:hypothetical protein